MDNFFELIIFFFIIYAIFGALLGKKKQQNSGRKIPPEIPGDAQTKTSPQSSRDIFEEMLGFKFPQNDTRYENLPPESQSNKKEMPSIDYDTDLKVDYKDLETTTLMPNIDFDKLTPAQIELVKKEDAIELHYENYKPRTEVNKKATEIKQKLMNPFSFREIFIVSEIINKPKALRR